MPPDKPTPQPRSPSPYEAGEQLRSTMLRFRLTVVETLKQIRHRQAVAIEIQNLKLKSLNQGMDRQRGWLIVVGAIGLLDLALIVLWRR